MQCVLKMASRIEGFDYEKLFRTNARLWSKVSTLEAAENLVLTDFHPLNYLRSNITCQQFDEFYQTFNVKEGDGMYLAPEDRLIIW